MNYIMIGEYKNENGYIGTECQLIEADTVKEAKKIASREFKVHCMFTEQEIMRILTGDNGTRDLDDVLDEVLSWKKSYFDPDNAADYIRSCTNKICDCVQFWIEGCA